MSLIAQAAMKYDIIKTVAAETKFSGNSAGKQKYNVSGKTVEHTWYSHNNLITNGADYYKYAEPEAVKEVLQRGYDDILIDFGSVKDGANELYWRCDKKFLVGSFTEWQQESFREFEMEQRAKQKKSWQSLAVFGSEETRREFSRRFRINAERIPFSADAFSVTKECGEFFQRIL